MNFQFANKKREILKFWELGLKRKIILKDAVVFRFIVIGRISFTMCEGANQNRAYV